MYMILMNQVSGEIGNADLQKIYHELLAAFQAINVELNFKSGSKYPVPRQLTLDITVILTEGWEIYDWWRTNKYFPEDFLRLFSQMLQNLGFSWCRTLDGVTRNLEHAIEKKNRPYSTEPVI